VDAKAQFRSLAEPWADTGTSTCWLMTAVLGGSAGGLYPAGRMGSSGEPPETGERR